MDSKNFDSKNFSNGLAKKKFDLAIYISFDSVLNAGSEYIIFFRNKGLWKNYQILKIKFIPIMGFELGRTKRKTVTQALTPPARYFKTKCYLIYLRKYELWPPISWVPWGYSKNGKISKQERIYGLSIGPGLIWI